MQVIPETKRLRRRSIPPVNIVSVVDIFGCRTYANLELSFTLDLSIARWLGAPIICRCMCLLARM